MKDAAARSSAARASAKFSERTAAGAPIERMTESFSDILYATSIWIIPVVVAATFHEAAHGFVAHLRPSGCSGQGSVNSVYLSAGIRHEKR